VGLYACSPIIPAIYQYFLIQRSAVGFVPDKYDDKPCDSSTQVCKVSNIVAHPWIYTSKKIDRKIA